MAFILTVGQTHDLVGVGAQVVDRVALAADAETGRAGQTIAVRPGVADLVESTGTMRRP